MALARLRTPFNSISHLCAQPPLRRPAHSTYRRARIHPSGDQHQQALAASEKTQEGFDAAQALMKKQLARETELETRQPSAARTWRDRRVSDRLMWRWIQC
jgi:hypothetical protein